MQSSPTYTQRTYPLAGNANDADLIVLTMGLFESRGNFRFAQSAKYHSMHVVKSGEGSFFVDGREHKVGARRIFTFFPGQFVKYNDYPETPWEYTWFIFAGEKVESVFESVGITKENPVVDISERAVFTSVLSTLEKELSSNPRNPFISRLGAWRIFHALSAEPACHRMEGRNSEITYNACKILIDSHHDNNISVDDLSDMLRVDRSTLFRLFKRYSGMSPKEYIDQRRFETARRLLADSNVAISKVAEACGFSEQHYFSRAFRKRFGVTPRDYRSPS